MNVITIDCDYIAGEFAAAYLIHQNGRAILVENNTEKCIPAIEGALTKAGLSFASLDYLFITHAHLDHAAASGRLLQLAPQATLCGHPKALSHLVNPAKLVEAVRHVYGDKRFDELYGGVVPVPTDRASPFGDGQTLTWQGLTFEFIHTRGHANHHACIIERASRVIFTGDTFGLRYPALQSNGLFIIPTTSPTGYEPDEALKSVERIRSGGYAGAYLTHFGLLTDIAEAAQQLKSDLEFSRDCVNRVAGSQTSEEELQKVFYDELKDHWEKRALATGLNWEGPVSQLLELDLDLNAAGMAVAALHLRRPRA
ncbi:MAG: MBL fold metallo-hydrolase [Deltaproteobacteria bacterium]|nr:MBL fold metallo-hydrolase [Deltaproteobacteria bacterium]MBI3295277.1 MBL fold metallo-hydrolase [Deltaproteobacteria bacterium]